MANTEKKQEIAPAREESTDEERSAAEKQMRDLGAELYLEVQQYSREELEAERKVVLRKIDWIIMPMVSLLHSFSFLLHFSGPRVREKTVSPLFSTTEP